MEAFPVDIQLFIQTLIWFGIVLTGLITSVPIGVTQTNFGGNCVLYGTFQWKNSSYFDYNFGPAATCHFIVYLHVFVSIVFACGMGIYYSYATYMSITKDKSIATHMWVMPFLLCNSVITAIIFITSCIVGVGFAQWCGGFLSGRDLGASIDGCASGQNMDIWGPTWNAHAPAGTSYFSGTFFNFMTVGQTASWVAFLLWTAQTSFTGIRLYRNIKLRSAGDGFVGQDEFADTANIGNTTPSA
ncbi:unnamed protein product [Owenia fusiformis]|uniref:Uncharacterized protein n=1 Tax=Owenia fusiformis TaxID=6347 RepID=A0A8J1U1W6_OWEFU|nr:unnamed protein product [Owenia fusiformis]